MTRDAALDDVLRSVWERNRAKLLHRLRRVRHAISSRTPVASEELRSDIHALIGALGTYGIPDGSALLEAIQHALANEPATASSLVGRLDTLIVDVETFGGQEARHS